MYRHISTTMRQKDRSPELKRTSYALLFLDFRCMDEYAVFHSGSRHRPFHSWWILVGGFHLGNRTYQRVIPHVERPQCEA